MSDNAKARGSRQPVRRRRLFLAIAATIVTFVLPASGSFLQDVGLARLGITRPSEQIYNVKVVES